MSHEFDARKYAESYLREYPYDIDDDVSKEILCKAIREYVSLSMNVEEKSVTNQQVEEVYKHIIFIHDGPDEVPIKALVDFKDYWPLFEGTHQHLGAIYNLLEYELQLVGAAYYPIKKALCYYAESLKQPTCSFFVGAIPNDNRIHLAFILSAGRGKGQIKKAVSQYMQSKYERMISFPAERVNIEQLIGKMWMENVKGSDGKRHEEAHEERGYLGYKGIIVDECQDLLAEQGLADGAIMIELRNAMEVYHKNTVQKKLTSEDLMSYDPESRCMFMLHYPNFPAVFFDRGTARRLLIFKAGTDPIPESAAINGLFGKSPTGEFKEYMNAPIEWLKDAAVVFDEAAIKELAEWIETWAHFTLTHSNQRVRALGQKQFTSVKDQFIRMVAILAIKLNEPHISTRTVAEACLDAMHFLLCTYEVCSNESQINLSRDVWRTVNPQEAMLFEWMHHNNATNEGKTKMTIAQVQVKIGEIFGVQDRQATGIFNKLVESGHLGRWKGKHESKAWLEFVPELEGGVALSNYDPIDLKDFIVGKIEAYNLRGARGAMKMALSRSAQSINNNNNNVYNIEKGLTDCTSCTSKPQFAPLGKVKPVNTDGCAVLCPVCGKSTTKLYDRGGDYMCVDCLNASEHTNDET